MDDLKSFEIDEQFIQKNMLQTSDSHNYGEEDDMDRNQAQSALGQKFGQQEPLGGNRNWFRDDFSWLHVDVWVKDEINSRSLADVISEVLGKVILESMHVLGPNSWNADWGRVTRISTISIWVNSGRSCFGEKLGPLLSEGPDGVFGDSFLLWDTAG